MNFRRSPTSVEILRIIATCTEVPRVISKHIIGSSRTIEDNFRFLVREKYVSKIKPKNGNISFRLNQKGKMVLCDPQVTGSKSKIFEKYFDKFAPELCGNTKQIYRLHKQAEIILALHNAKIKSFVDEKMFLSEISAIKRMGVSPCFFNSQELKKCFARQDKFASASRTIGTVLTPDNIFFTYNSGKYPINFSVDQERKAFQTFCEVIIKKGFVPLNLISKIAKALVNNCEAFYINARSTITDELSSLSGNPSSGNPKNGNLNFPIREAAYAWQQPYNNAGICEAERVNTSIDWEPNSSATIKSAASHKNGNPVQVSPRSPRKSNSKVICEAPASQSTKPSSFASAKPIAKPPTLASNNLETQVNCEAAYVTKLRESLDLIKRIKPEQFIKEYIYGNVLNIERNHCDFPYIASIDKAIEKWVINYCNENRDAIVFGEDWEATRRMLEMSDDYMAKTLIQPKNGAYNTMRYIPNTRDGEETLEIIMRHAWKERMLSRIVPPEDVADGIPYETGCDLYTKDHLACYCMIDMNLTRLIDMKRWLVNRDEERVNYNMKLICFEYQEELLKEWFGNLVKEEDYVTISIEDAKGIMEETKTEYGEWEEELKRVCEEIGRIK